MCSRLLPVCFALFRRRVAEGSSSSSTLEQRRREKGWNYKAWPDPRGTAWQCEFPSVFKGNVKEKDCKEELTCDLMNKRVLEIDG